jgi:hypothetical protein
VLARLRAIGFVALILGACACATPQPPLPAPAPALPPPIPSGAKRLADSIACESEATRPGTAPTGHLDKEAIEAVVSAHLGELRRCHDAIQAIHPATEGRVMARFAIAPSGIVQSSCLVTSSMNDATLDRCVVERLLGWTFRRPEGGGWVVVNRPFVFGR